MIQERLKGSRLILASGSPRRHEFFRQLGLDFEVRVKPVEEVFPESLKGPEIPVYLAKLKAEALRQQLTSDEILITSDTIVWHENTCLGKPVDAKDAADMLTRLSGSWHEVISAICITTRTMQETVYHSTEVHFMDLSVSEIDHYIKTYKPYDKAGAYGIQEWIGLIGIDEIRGSYFNVMGMPTHLLYKTLMKVAV
ncbi:Maf family nucleotide pyrophosphatase [Poritiphilus flavus]|uniref:dTTP/UTP pyrophosphatase n=1 Tax=Poritiphilus flavus TaxID=2697053 RepID=A0A6L9EEF6_9FLAO|nr:Maf family nucleotide pyrophosphatase [Poritiphilus flavus]NAS12972.1 septum formation protein Maf [Poritiphilus flavus]